MKVAEDDASKPDEEAKVGEAESKPACDKKVVANQEERVGEARKPDEEERVGELQSKSDKKVVANQEEGEACKPDEEERVGELQSKSDKKESTVRDPPSPQSWDLKLVDYLKSKKKERSTKAGSVKESTVRDPPSPQSWDLKLVDYLKSKKKERSTKAGSVKEHLPVEVQQEPKKLPAPKIHFDNEAIIGKRVTMDVPSLERWSNGVVKSYNRVLDRHKIWYEDKSEELVDLKQLSWKLMDDPIPFKVQASKSADTASNISLGPEKKIAPSAKSTKKTQCSSSKSKVKGRAAEKAPVQMVHERLAN